MMGTERPSGDLASKAQLAGFWSLGFFNQVISREVVGGVIIVLLFVLAAIYSHDLAAYAEQSLFLGGVWGMVLYFAANVVAVVIAPFTVFFTIFLAAVLWGPLPAAALSVSSWTVGSAIAFYLAKSFGKSIIKRLVSMERVSRLEQLIPQRHTFFWLILLRMITPVDILSYALGLFSGVSWSLFLSTTIIGIIPFALIFAFVLVVPPWLGTALVLLGTVILLSGMIFVYRRASYKLGREEND
ncbi:MAG: hypothetical protein G01um1014107_88 [Parcubacteria group bacterium Gr01-1014_107]|nr:MAG: hypothetical protein G01um1014107_88 [Parcubacteria group bacterium Gr01-1014_107]